MRGDVSAPVPAAAAHQAPVAEALARSVRVVQVRPAEEQVPELVRAHADLAVLGNRQITEDFRAVSVVRAPGQHPFVGPDVIGVAGLLGARTGVHDDERIHEPVAVVVVRREVHIRIRQLGRVARHRPGIRLRVVGPCLPARVHGEGSREPVRADDLAGSVNRPLLASVKYSRTLPVGILPVEKNRSLK